MRPSSVVIRASVAAMVAISRRSLCGDAAESITQ